MTDDQLLRYSRHILLPEIGIDGQEKILAARVLIVGAGGLGSPAALYLASAGVGHLTLVDHDSVDLTNLQRQIVHRTSSIGRPKVESARQTLQEINPEIQIEPIAEKLAGERLRQLVSQSDLVLDATDNFATRHAINHACVMHHRPLVSGAAVRFDGQVSVFDLRHQESPCYACLFAEDGETEEVRCAVMGVFAPLVGIVGSVQAAEALKVITGSGRDLCGRLLILDALQMEWRVVKIRRDSTCKVCANRPAT